MNNANQQFDLNNPQNLIQIYKSINKAQVLDIEVGRRQFTLPVCPPKLVERICTDSLNIFSQEKVILDINIPVIIIGDIHGHLVEILRVFNRFGWPPSRNYIFLGDLVDRGEFSLETVILVLSLKICYPSSIYIIRGNHEFQELYSRCGFENEITAAYGDKLSHEIFGNVFSHIPIAALIYGKYLCLHGGIGPELNSLSDIEMIKKPLSSFEEADDVALSILWSDPNRAGNGFSQSVRGSGYLFGADALLKFLSNNNLEMLIRGHECVVSGVEFLFNRKLVTVFGASNYCNGMQNRSGILIFKDANTYESVTFTPIHAYPRRKDAEFYPLSLFFKNVNNNSKVSGLGRLPLLNIPEHMKKKSCGSACSHAYQQRITPVSLPRPIISRRY